MFAVRDIVIFAVVAGVAAATVLAAWSWARRRGRFVLAGLATTLGFIAWNLTLNATNATGFNVDAPVIGLSWADAGSGVGAFVCTALVLGLGTERRESAGHVVGAAALAGLAAILVDLFVL
ncbi:MAG: hypothetical protein H0V42_08775 [Nocardioidaceae bacterium]|nr:hypothetical protein [Nocardioidaceae bacterium]